MIYSVTALSGGKRLVCYYDVTEMKNREADLAAANDKTAELFANLRLMVDSMSVGIVVLDAGLRTEIINRAFYELWRIDPAKVGEGSTFRDLMEASRGIDAHGVDDADWQAPHRHARGRTPVRPYRFARAGTLGRPRHDLQHGAACRRQGARFLCRHHRDEGPRGRARRRAGAVEARRGSDQRRQGSDLRQGQRSALRLRQRGVLQHVRTHARSHGRQKRSAISSPLQRRRSLRQPNARCFRPANPYELEEAPELAGRQTARRIVRKNRVSMASGKRLCRRLPVRHDRHEAARDRGRGRAHSNLADVLESHAGRRHHLRPRRQVRVCQPQAAGLAAGAEAGLAARQHASARRSSSAIRSAISAPAAIPRSTSSTTSTRERWLDDILARYHLPHFVFERRNPDGRWYQVYDMRTDDGTFIGVRVDITELKSREKALREVDAPDRPVPPCARRAAGRRLHQVRRPAHRIRQQGLDRDLPASPRKRPSATPTCELFGSDEAEGLHAMATPRSAPPARSCEIEEPVTHRDGTVRQLMTRKSRLVAIDGSVHLVGSSTDITEVKAREDALQESLRENEVFRSLIDNVPVSIYAKRADLRLFYVNKGWCDLTGFSHGRCDRQDRRRDFRRGRRSLHGRRPRRAAHRRHAGDRGDRDACRRQRAPPDRAQERDGRVRRLALSDRLDHRHHRAEAARDRNCSEAQRSAPCSPTAPSRNSWPI